MLPALTALVLAAHAAHGDPADLPASADPAHAQAAPARNASDPVADKFRRLQGEMARGESQSVAPARETPAGEPQGVTVISLAVKIACGLGFVLILAIVAIRLLKRLQGGMLSRGRKAGGEIFEVLETCHLGPHQRVVALRMNDEVGIVGVTQQGMSLLTVLKEPAEDLRRQAQGAANPAAFSENLNKLLDRFKRPKRVSDLLDEGEA